MEHAIAPDDQSWPSVHSENSSQNFRPNQIPSLAVLDDFPISLLDVFCAQFTSGASATAHDVCFCAAALCTT